MREERCPQEQERRWFTLGPAALARCPEGFWRSDAGKFAYVGIAPYYSDVWLLLDGREVAANRADYYSLIERLPEYLQSGWFREVPDPRLPFVRITWDQAR